MIRPAPSLAPESHPEATLQARPMGIDTYQEPVVYMRSDCPVCRSEGFESQSRVRVAGNGRALVATLNVVRGELLAHGEAGLSEAAWALLGLDVEIAITDGSQPVGRGIGPALEARDVLAVLQREVAAPADLRARAACAHHPSPPTGTRLSRRGPVA